MVSQGDRNEQDNCKANSNEFNSLSAKQEKHFLTVGPLLPAGDAAGRNKGFTLPGYQEEKIHFVDLMAEQYGSKSLLYIRCASCHRWVDAELVDSFETFLFPPNDEQIRILRDVLLECKVPFLIARGQATEVWLRQCKQP